MPALLPAVAGFSSPALAAPGSLLADSDVEVGINYRTWTSDSNGIETTLSQFVLPVYFHSSLRENVDFSYLFNAVSSELSLDSVEESSLSGVTDGKLALDYFLHDRRFSVGLGLRLPTGESRLDVDEELVALALNDRILGFRVKRYGEGTDVELRGGYAATVNPKLTLATGVSYVAKGDFNFLSSTDRVESTYEPGDELSLVGKMRALALAREWTSQIRLATYGTDHRDGVEELEEGTEVGVRLGMREEHLIGVAEFAAEAVWKEETRLLSAAGLPPVRDVSGNILRLDGDFYGRLDQAKGLGGHLAATWYGENDVGTGDGFILELGGRYRQTIGSLLAAQVGYTFMTGDAEDGTIELDGHDVSVTVGLGGGIW
jgi:hypothetical protein